MCLILGCIKVDCFAIEKYNDDNAHLESWFTLHMLFSEYTY